MIRLPWFKTKRPLGKALEPRKKNLSPTMTLEQKFNFIYENRLWGRDPERLSGPGSYGDCAETYLAFVRTFLSDYSIRSVTDIGCGDFNIGSQLCDLVDRYYALDVSSTIVRRNRKRYGGFRNVTFAVADACAGELPPAELVTVRQVLQHLTNDQISKVLNNIERSGFKYALITEHIVSPAAMARPNLDLPHDSDMGQSPDR